MTGYLLDVIGYAGVHQSNYKKIHGAKKQKAALNYGIFW
jgi:hypothetical protein